MASALGPVSALASVLVLVLALESASVRVWASESEWARVLASVQVLAWAAGWLELLGSDKVGRQALRYGLSKLAWTWSG